MIVGCGYLGQRLAERLLARGVTVYGTIRNPDKGRRLAELGVKPMLVHVTQPLTLAALRPALETDSLDVYYLVPPGRPTGSPSARQVVLGGVAHMIKALKQANVRRAVLVSSTAVYGQRNGQHVDAETPAKPLDDRGRLLLDGENLWLDAGAPDAGPDAGPKHHVVRLAGLYGPYRIIGLQALHEGAPLVGDPQALLNLVHVDDAADLLVKVMEANTPGRVELGCDGHPVPRLTYYQHLADRLGLAPPEVLDDETAARQLGLNVERLRRVSSKALDNLVTCRRTDWRPRYASYREGLEAALAATKR